MEKRVKLSFQQFTDKLENILDTLTSTEEQVTNAEPVSAHPDKIREQLADNNVSQEQLATLLLFIYIFEAILKWIHRFLQPFIASWITQIWLTATKLTCPCNRLRTSNSFAKSDTCVVIDSDPQLSRRCKTSLLFAPLAVRHQAGCSAFPFYTLTKLLLQLYLKYKTVLIPKLKQIFIF